ncbi:chitinase class I [Dictyocaulus viviparus]|uniref:Chitinase class I n=1 Tax=Dictyocaulus viviparus TaxID=29172 RepID=A0A0D8Y1N0_DICVI|nr:chitinase class I [Dictyocaulus viviparus]
MASNCEMPSDPNKLAASPLEQWFKKEMFEDLFPFANLGWGPHPCSPYSYEAFVIAARYFPKFGTSSPNTDLFPFANLGWGPHPCSPYSYEAFVIAARYFPKFGTSSPNTVYNETENTRRDLAAFFSHAVQETGENNAALYESVYSQENNMNCVNTDIFLHKGGFYNWFEGGPISSFLDKTSPGYSPSDGDKCNAAGRYCVESAEINHFYPCSKNQKDGYFTGCYFGRGAIQNSFKLSYNYNYGQFMDFLRSKNISVDLLNEPNLIMTKTDPPLALLASLWFYLTPQPPKPAMHDIVMGTWNSGEKNAAAGYTGPIFGPTSLIINNECNGEDKEDPGGPGESRRIKAFKWFCEYFNVPAGDDRLLSCKEMPVKLDSIRYNYSYQPDWNTTWKEERCNCAPAGYGGLIPYFDPAYYPKEFVEMNEANRLKCVASIYANPSMYSLSNTTSICLNF